MCWFRYVASPSRIPQKALNLGEMGFLTLRKYRSDQLLFWPTKSSNIQTQPYLPHLTSVHPHILHFGQTVLEYTVSQLPASPRVIPSAFMGDPWIFLVPITQGSQNQHCAPLNCLWPHAHLHPHS